MAHADVPETQADQGDQGNQRLGEITQQQGPQAVVIGVEQQGHVRVRGQVPEQPGVVVLIDSGVFPQVGVGHHNDRAEPMVELHHVRGPGAVGPGLGEIVRVFEMERGVEAGVGRRVFVFQIELGECGIGVVADDGRWVLEVFAQGLVQLDPVQQQIVALPGLLIPQRLSDEQQAPAGPGPAHQLVNLPGCHVVAVAEQQQAMVTWLQAGQDIEAVGMADGQALFAQEMFGGQVGIGLGFGRGAVVDFRRIGDCLEVQINTQCAQQHGNDYANH